MRISNPREFEIEERWSPNRSRQKPWIKRRVFLLHHTGNGVNRATLQGAVSWFLNRHSGVSSDFVIGRDGEIVRMIPRGWTGWHAGVCLWGNKPYRSYNHLAYGLELVNTGDGNDPWPEIQLEAMAYVCAVIQAECPTVRYPRRHGDVAIPSGRKVDPAGLSITRIYDSIRLYQKEVVLG